MILRTTVHGVCCWKVQANPSSLSYAWHLRLNLCSRELAISHVHVTEYENVSSLSSRLHNGLHKRAFFIVPNTYAYFALFVHCQTGASMNINLSCVCFVPLRYQTIWVYPIVLIVLYGLNECASVIKSRFIPLRTMGYTKMGRLPIWLVNKESESNRRVVSFQGGGDVTFTLEWKSIP